LRQQVTSRPFV